MEAQSPEMYDEVSEEQADGFDVEPKQEDLSDPASPNGEDEEGDSQNKGNVPMQKRRRVTRACDECRRKKIKCDGKQPCTHCTVYSYGMFYAYAYAGVTRS